MQKVFNQTGGPRNDTEDLKRLLAEMKTKLQHAQPDLRPEGSQGPNTLNWDTMREKTDQIHSIQKRQHQQKQKLRQDFDISR